MRITSSNDLRKNLATMLDAVTADREPIVITRNGRRRRADVVGGFRFP